MQVEREFHHARTQHGEDGFDRVWGPDGAHLLERLRLQHLREDLQRKERDLVAYLHSCRTRWAWAWTHGRSSAGMHASQRAEGLHSTLRKKAGRVVLSSLTPLVELVWVVMGLMRAGQVSLEAAAKELAPEEAEVQAATAGNNSSKNGGAAH